MEVDMISNLGDDVLVHILSFLPLKHAASTSLLSRRWFDLWKQTPKLIFQNDALWTYNVQTELKYINWVNSVLNLYKGDLQEFAIGLYATKSNRNDVTKWLEFAFSRRVEKLDFNLGGRYFCKYALLLEEILENITLPSSTGSIQSLKVLCLRQTKTSGEAIQFFLRNCPMLEELVIEDATITSDLEVVGLSLKCLDIRPITRDISIKVSAPNLTSLEINYDTSKLFLENVPKLVHMIFCYRPDSTMHHFATVASQLETLTVYKYPPEASFLALPEMPKLKKLFVHDCYHDFRADPMVRFSVASCLRMSPCLEEFEVKITKLTFEIPKVGPVFQHSSLKRLKLLWSCGGLPCHDRTKLVRYVVENCVALEGIDISQCDGLESWREYGVVVDDFVRVATTEERVTFEKTARLQLPAHIKLRILNHSHLSPSDCLHNHSHKSPMDNHYFNFA